MTIVYEGELKHIDSSNTCNELEKSYYNLANLDPQVAQLITQQQQQLQQQQAMLQQQQQQMQSSPLNAASPPAPTSMGSPTSPIAPPVWGMG